MWLGSLILGFVRKNLIGTAMVETGFRLRKDPDTVLAPDVSVVALDGFLSGRVPQGFIDGILFWRSKSCLLTIPAGNSLRKSASTWIAAFRESGWFARKTGR